MTSSQSMPYELRTLLGLSVVSSSVHLLSSCPLSFVTVSSTSAVLRRESHTTLLSHPTNKSQNISAITLGRNTNIVVIAFDSSPSDIIVWNISDSAKPVVQARIEQHLHAVKILELSPDERFLFSLDTSGVGLVVDLASVSLCCTTSLRDVHVLKWGPRHTHTNAYNIAIAHANTNTLSALLFNPHTGKITQERVNIGHMKRIFTCLVWTETQLFAGTTSGDVLEIQSSTLTFTRLLESVGPSGAVGGVCPHLQSNGKYHINVVRADGTIIKYTDNGNKYVDQQLVKYDGSVHSLSSLPSLSLFSTREGHLYSMMPDLTVQLLARAHAATITALAVGQEDQVVTGDEKGNIIIWSLDQQACIECFTVPFSISSLCLSATTMYIGTRGNEGSIIGWDLVKRAEQWRIKDAHKLGVSSLALAANESFLVSSGDTGELRRWDLKTKKISAQMKEHILNINQIYLFPDSRRVLSVGRDKRLCEVDIQSEKRLSCHEQRMGAIHGVAVVANTIVTVGQDLFVRFWNLQQAEAIGSILLKSEPLCITSDTVHLVIGASDGTICIFDGEKRTQMSEFQGHSSAIKLIAFSSDHRYFVTVVDGAIGIWQKQ